MSHDGWKSCKPQIQMIWKALKFRPLCGGNQRRLWLTERQNSETATQARG